MGWPVAGSWITLQVGPHPSGSGRGPTASWSDPDPNYLSNQPGAYLVRPRHTCIDFARQNLDVCRHAA
jgi:hypothetical protein